MLHTTRTPVLLFDRVFIDTITHSGFFNIIMLVWLWNLGTYALPGGRLEFQESFEDCAARELEEETGIRVLTKDVHFMTCTNNILHQDSGKHYVTIFMVARLPVGQEPEVCGRKTCFLDEGISCF